MNVPVSAPQVLRVTCSEQSKYSRNELSKECKKEIIIRFNKHKDVLTASNSYIFFWNGEFSNYLQSCSENKGFTKKY
jgi:hypothetical protein